MSGINAFQHTAFQQTVGHVAFQELISTTTSGRYLEDSEYLPFKRHWLEEGLKLQLRHMAAVHLGRKGGLWRSH